MIEHCDECGAEIEPETDPLTGELDTFGPLMDHYAEEHPETMTENGGNAE